MHDVICVGAGPCGIGVGAAARRAGVDCLLLDKGSVVSSIARYPIYMTFFSTAERLEIAGVPFIPQGEKPTRLEALKYYQRLVQHFDLAVKQYEQVTAIERIEHGFVVRSVRADGSDHERTTRNVVVATGYFDSPNMLGIPGEELPKVQHNYREGHPFFQQRVVVIGGGNSAVDAALELYRWGAQVTIVHFGAALDPNVKPWVRPDIEARMREAQIAARWNSRVTAVTARSVTIHDDSTSRDEELPNDFVLAMTGYTPNPQLLEGVGVEIDGSTGIPAHDPGTMETNVPGVFIAGVIAAGNDANKVFIENGRDHGARIIAHIVAARARALESD